jgi:hypothetical protein
MGNSTRRGVGNMQLNSVKGADGNGHINLKPELRSDALQSWKEIAAYLKRGVRTAQRWERCAGLPVRRPRAGDRSPVFAFPSEIDEWMHSRPTRTFD